MNKAEKSTATIMIVDDDSIFLEELGEVLESGGYAMITVDDPTRVIENAYRFRPKVILLDIKMPGKSGLEVAHELQFIPELAGTPIIATSAFVKEDSIPFMKACGIKKFLRKPFNPLNIIWEIEDALKMGECCNVEEETNHENAHDGL